MKIKTTAVFCKNNSDFAEKCMFFILQIDICWRIEKILVHCMRNMYTDHAY